MNPTSRFRSVLFWLGLAFATFVLVALGYSTGFWSRKARAGAGAERDRDPARHIGGARLRPDRSS